MHARRRRWALTAAMIGSALAVSACSDGGDASPSNATNGSTSTSPPTSLTSESAATSAPPTSSSSTPPDTKAPRTTSTVDAEELVEREVRASFMANRRSWVRCMRTMPECDIAKLKDTYTGAQLRRVTQLVREDNAAGRHVRRLDLYKNRVDDISVDGDVATVTVCERDAAVVYVPATTAGEPDQIVNDIWYTNMLDWTLERGDDGRWRAASFTPIRRAEGRENDLCDA